MIRPYRAPSGSYEALALLYADVLGVDRVGLDDDFFELGGTDRTLPKLVTAIHERFGLEVTEEAVREAPTVAALGSRLGERRTRGAPLVLELSPSEARDATPFFCVAGGGGPAVQLHALAAAMVGRPFYGVQQRGLEELARPDWRVPPFARRALREVRAIQPEGPYFLGGHSYGTLVAFEMACQLIDAGAEVGLLVLVDVPVPPWVTAEEVRSRTASAHARDRARRSVTVSTKRAARNGRLRLKRAYRRASLTTIGLIPRRGLQQYDQFYVLGLHIGRRYNPRARCSAPTLVVRAMEVEYFLDPIKTQPDLGWSRLLSGPVTCVDAPGNHLTMIRKPYAAMLAALIEAQIGPNR